MDTLSILTVVTFVAGLVHGQDPRPNVDMFPTNPPRNDLSIQTNYPPFIRYEPCRGPYTWSTLVNEYVLTGRQCDKQIKVFGGFENMSSSKRRQKFIEMTCRNGKCEAQPMLKETCSSDQHLIITSTKIETSSAYGNLTLLNGKDQYAIMPKDLNNRDKMLLPPFIAQTNFKFIYHSTEDIKLLKIELNVCCSAKKPLECKFDANGYFYEGTINVTTSGKTCQKWACQTPHAHSYTEAGGAGFIDGNEVEAKNYCRNPTQKKYGYKPWCFTTDPNTLWEYCDIPLCAYKCKHTTKGKEYFGVKSVTESGKECQAWASQSPHSHEYTTAIGAIFPPGENEWKAGNFCRNPTLGQTERERPWCYTTDAGTLWEYCDIPFCEELD